MLTSGKRIGEERFVDSDGKHRVENTTPESKPTSKAGEIPYNCMDLTTAEIMSQRMYNTNSVISGLITGTQWDVMVNWMSNKEDKSDLKQDCTWGNYNDIVLHDLTGKYCTLDGGSNMSSDWTDVSAINNTKPTGYYLLTTGSTEEVKRKNLYDVAGNLWERTQECALGSQRNVARGGSSFSGHARMDCMLSWRLCLEFLWKWLWISCCIVYKVVN